MQPPTTHHPPLTDLVAFAHQLADAAGAAIRPYFGAHGAVETKGDDSPVTQADRAAETAMRALIETHYPNHSIYGEEFGLTNRESRITNHYTWVLDPIDGTRAFIAGKKEWGTLIALCEHGVPILGILDQPVTGERWVGAKGMPTVYSSSLRAQRSNPLQEGWIATSPSAPRNDVFEISTRPCSTLAEAIISTTSQSHFTPAQAQRYTSLAAQCAEAIDGGDCYAYGLLARGMRDVVVDAGLKPYDILALVPIIEGAGGMITGWDGAAVTLTHFSNVLASGGPELHANALEILAQTA